MAFSSLEGLGIVAWEQGNDAQATALLKEVLSMCRQQGDQEVIALRLEGLAGCATRQRQALRAARLFGAAEQLRDLMSAPHAPLERQRYLEAAAEVRAGLDAEAFEQAWRDGRTLPLEEVMAYAMASYEMDR